jgi:hypothetical protein
MKVILIVPDEGYSRNASWALNLVYTILFHQVSGAIHIPKFKAAFFNKCMVGINDQLVKIPNNSSLLSTSFWYLEELVILFQDI